MGRTFSPEHRAAISAAMKGRTITWGAKISASLAAAGPRARRPLSERFASKVARGEPDACWTWTGAIDTTGYGVMAGPTRGKVYAHRVAYELANGPIPTGLEIRHACDNRPCVNVAHLSVGTRTDNMQDAVARGRNHAPWRGMTHCKRGHEFTPENTRFDKGRFHRSCRTCGREWMAAARAAKRAHQSDSP